jgi:predicted nucleic acid-binding protein
MTFVVDASIALAWCFEDEADAAADEALARLEGEDAVAPSIWSLEVANGLRSAERRGRIDEREIPGVVRLLTALPIAIEAGSLERALGDVLQLARALGLSTYDAAYVDIALRKGLPLATADDYLAQAAVAAGALLLEPMSAEHD